MAMAIRFVCGGCERTIEAWSDGNPYYIDEAGAKKYAYHPDHERLSKCIGNDDPHLCLFVDPRVRAQQDDPDGEIGYCVDMLNRIADGVDGIKLALHLCRRNKGRAGWVGEGGYEPILPALRDLQFDMLMLEFAIPVAGDKRILRDLPERFDVGLGCVDCRSPHIDTPQEIASRVRQALEYVAPERITLHPDCGFSPGSAADIPIDEAYQQLRREALAAQRLRSEYA